MNYSETKRAEPLYRVTKHFTDETLKGITITELTRVKFEVGFECKKPSGGSPYVVTAVEVVR